MRSVPGSGIRASTWPSVSTTLLLKCLWVPSATPRLLEAFGALRETYLSGVAWEQPAELEARAATLLPGLLLARVDGKSPVEYLTSDADRDVVRRVARAGLLEPASTLADVASRWGEEMARSGAGGGRA